MALRTFIRSLTSAADGVEHASEWVLDRVFASGKADAFDFTRELIRVLDFHALRGPDGKKIAPNRYTLSLRPDLYHDYAPLVREYEANLVDRLQREIRARKYETKGKVDVRLIEGDGAQRDEMLVVCVISADTVITSPRLQLVGGEGVYPLRKDTTTVGRHPDSDIFLSHEKVSGHHAELYSTPDGYALVDLTSTNGTTLNGQSLTPQEIVAIGEGDTVCFAVTEFEVAHVS